MIECKIEKGNLTVSAEGKPLELLTEAAIIALDTIFRCSKDEASFLHNKNILVHLIAKMQYEDLNAGKDVKNDVREKQ